MASTTLPGVLLTGNHASRPAANAVGTGTLYSCTTHSLVYQSDGSSWSTWATLGGGGLTQAYVGYNTAGGSWEAITASRHYLKSVTIAANCELLSIDLYLKGNASNVWDVGVFVTADAAGTPGEMLAANKSGSNGNNAFYLNSNGRWFSLPLPIYLPAATYWFGFWGISGAMSIAYDGSGSDKYYAGGGNFFTDYSIVGSNTGTSNKYSIRGNTIS